MSEFWQTLVGCRSFVWKDQRKVRKFFGSERLVHPEVWVPVSSIQLDGHILVYILFKIAIYGFSRLKSKAQYEIDMAVHLIFYRYVIFVLLVSVKVFENWLCIPW